MAIYYSIILLKSVRRTKPRFLNNKNGQYAIISCVYACGVCTDAHVFVYVSACHFYPFYFFILCYHFFQFLRFYYNYIIYPFPFLPLNGPFYISLLSFIYIYAYEYMPKYMTTTCSVCIMPPIFMISEEFAVTFCLPGLPVTHP